jgi:hypothetical protein
MTAAAVSGTPLRTGAAVGLAGLAAIAPLCAQEPQTRTLFVSKHGFFAAVKRGDISAATAMIDGKVAVAEWEQDRLRRKAFTTAEFFDRVKPCHYQAGFVQKDDPDTEMGVWMCALTPTTADPNLSKTIMVQANFKGERVTLDSYNEQESMMPAPAQGS